MVIGSFKLVGFLGLVIITYYLHSDDSKEKKYKFITNFLNILFGFMLIPSLGILFFMGMFIGAGRLSVGDKVFALSGLSFPMVIITSIWFSLKYYNEKKYKRAMYCSIAPYLNVVYFLVCMQLMVH